MKKKPTVTIGIPAYNEESNIKRLLLSLLEQRLEGVVVENIIVISDASTDATVREARQVKNKKILVFDQKDRKGQALRQKELFDMNRSDFLILLNADVLPANALFVSNIIKPFLTNKSIGIVGAHVAPLPSKTYIERIINFSVRYKQRIFEQIHNGNTVYLCHGRARAFSRAFIRKFTWKPLLNEDAYSYMECVKLGFLFQYEPEAVVRYRSPQNLQDHLRQSKRFLVADRELHDLFDEETLTQNYHIPVSLIIKTFGQFLAKNPTLMMEYMVILTISKISLFLHPSYSLFFEPSATSKRLIL